MKTTKTNKNDKYNGTENGREVLNIKMLYYWDFK